GELRGTLVEQLKDVHSDDQPDAREEDDDAQLPPVDALVPTDCQDRIHHGAEHDERALSVVEPDQHRQQGQRDDLVAESSDARDEVRGKDQQSGEEVKDDRIHYWTRAPIVARPLSRPTGWFA